jgi:hypothetical protein
MDTGRGRKKIGEEKQRQILRDLDLSRKAWKLYRQGKTIVEIAASLKHPKTNIARLVDGQKKRWQEEIVIDTSAWAAEAIAELREVAAAAWDKFLESCKTRTIVEQTVCEDGRKRTKRKIEYRDGVPAYLNIIADCIRKEGEIRGIYRQDVNITQQVAMINHGMEDTETTRSMDASMFPPSVVYRQYAEMISGIADDGSDGSNGDGIEKSNGHANNGHDSLQQDNSEQPEQPGPKSPE